MKTSAWVLLAFLTSLFACGYMALEDRSASRGIPYWRVR